jgi:hypothetical protein
MRGCWRVYRFVEVDGQNIRNVLCLAQRPHVDIVNEARASYYVSGATQSERDRFASWLRYRCEQQLATEAHAHGNTTDVISGDTSDL